MQRILTNATVEHQMQIEKQQQTWCLEHYPNKPPNINTDYLANMEMLKQKIQKCNLFLVLISQKCNLKWKKFPESRNAVWKVLEKIQIMTYIKYGRIMFFNSKGFLVTYSFHSSRSILPSPFVSVSMNFCVTNQDASTSILGAIIRQQSKLSVPHQQLFQQFHLTKQDQIHLEESVPSPSTVNITLGGFHDHTYAHKHFILIKNYKTVVQVSLLFYIIKFYFETTKT